MSPRRGGASSGTTPVHAELRHRRLMRTGNPGTRPGPAARVGNGLRAAHPDAPAPARFGDALGQPRSGQCRTARGRGATAFRSAGAGHSRPGIDAPPPRAGVRPPASRHRGAARAQAPHPVRGAAGLREGVRPADVREADQPGDRAGSGPAGRPCGKRTSRAWLRDGPQTVSSRPGSQACTSPEGSRRRPSSSSVHCPDAATAYRFVPTTAGQPAGWSTCSRTCSSSRRRLVSRASATACSPGSWPASKNDRCTVTSLAPPSRPATWSQPA